MYTVQRGHRVTEVSFTGAPQWPELESTWLEDIGSETIAPRTEQNQVHTDTNSCTNKLDKGDSVSWGQNSS